MKGYGTPYHSTVYESFFDSTSDLVRFLVDEGFKVASAGTVVDIDRYYRRKPYRLKYYYLATDGYLIIVRTPLFATSNGFAARVPLRVWIADRDGRLVMKNHKVLQTAGALDSIKEYVKRAVHRARQRIMCHCGNRALIRRAPQGGYYFSCRGDAEFPHKEESSTIDFGMPEELLADARAKRVRRQAHRRREERGREKR
ncbi:MAG: hypothetical protein AAB420_00790 [Patescibacteria group bacterium]